MEKAASEAAKIVAIVDRDAVRTADRADPKTAAIVDPKAGATGRNIAGAATLSSRDETSSWDKTPPGTAPSPPNR